MQQPTKAGWRYVKHVSSYLFGTRDEGILLEAGPKGRSVLNINNTDGERKFEFEDGEKCLLEVVCDAEYAGDQRTRRSVSSVQIYLDGNLMESYVRCQKSIALSSGEREYIAMVGGVSEAMFIQHCWEFLTEEKAEMVCRSDSSAARSLAQRVGIGRPRTSQQTCCGFNRRSLRSCWRFAQLWRHSTQRTQAQSVCQRQEWKVQRTSSRWSMVMMKRSGAVSMKR